eukprot:gene12907-15161_t
MSSSSGASGKFSSVKTKNNRTIQDVQISDTLSDEQRAVVQRTLEGESLFFTGSAGTGKSFVLREIVRVLRFLHGEAVHVTASTGIAACNIGGTTLHSFAGVGLGDKTSKDYIRTLSNHTRNAARWRAARVLIIDEVSMISAEFLDKLEEIGRGVRRSPKAFGGIQVILVGDFCQLPPVTKGSQEASFCFKANCWDTVVQHSILLTKVYRQKDNRFVNILNELRFDPHRNRVEEENTRRIMELDGAAQEYEAMDEGTEPYLGMLKNMQAPTNLTLKVGSQVILLKNLDFECELVNGSRGVVISWSDTSDEVLPIVRFTNGTERVISREVWKIEVGGLKMASRSQVPLSLAWALSIHKSQGMSIDKLIIDLQGTFEYGQAYVALSRATSLEGLQLKSPLQPSQLKVSKEVVEFYKQMEQS